MLSLTTRTTVMPRERTSSRKPTRQSAERISSKAIHGVYFRPSGAVLATATSASTSAFAMHSLYQVSEITIMSHRGAPSLINVAISVSASSQSSVPQVKQPQSGKLRRRLLSSVGIMCDWSVATTCFAPRASRPQLVRPTPAPNSQTHRSLSGPITPASRHSSTRSGNATPPSQTTEPVTPGSRSRAVSCRTTSWRPFKSNFTSLSC
mmetsp:Transcript_4360/g.9753  ORF Transcript_4360/g.9753 Transcript_4360/m.9753 type:complete len:207 (+) Transcript_4360:751-1371(+)